MCQIGKFVKLGTALRTPVQETNAAGWNDSVCHGMTQFAWENGKCMAWDVTCVDTLAKSHEKKTSKLAGSAAEHAEQLKNEKCAHLTHQFDFYPIGFETFGSWGPSAMDILDQIGKRIKEHTGDSRAMDFLRQKISVEIQRGNAVSVLGTVEQMTNFDGPFFLLSLRNFDLPRPF